MICLPKAPGTRSDTQPMPFRTKTPFRDGRTQG